MEIYVFLWVKKLKDEWGTRQEGWGQQTPEGKGGAR